jgi:sec-independent protein translocase protein TatA
MGSDLLIALIVILVIVLIWRGPKNLPKLGGALGRSVKDFRNEIGGDDEASAKASTEASTEASTATPPKDGPSS